MQLLDLSAVPASHARKGGGRLAEVEPVLSIAIKLSRDGDDRTFKPLGNLRNRVLLLNKVSDGNAFFGKIC